MEETIGIGGGDRFVGGAVCVAAHHGSELCSGKMRGSGVDVGSREARYHPSSVLNAAKRRQTTRRKGSDRQYQYHRSKAKA